MRRRPSSHRLGQRTRRQGNGAASRLRLAWAIAAACSPRSLGSPPGSRPARPRGRQYRAFQNAAAAPYAVLPMFVVYGRPMISHSAVLSVSRSPIGSSIGRTRRATSECSELQRDVRPCATLRAPSPWSRGSGKARHLPSRLAKFAEHVPPGRGQMPCLPRRSSSSYWC